MCAIEPTARLPSRSTLQLCLRQRPGVIKSPVEAVDCQCLVTKRPTTGEHAGGEIADRPTTPLRSQAQGAPGSNMPQQHIHVRFDNHIVRPVTAARPCTKIGATANNQPALEATKKPNCFFWKPNCFFSKPAKCDLPPRLG